MTSRFFKVKYSSLPFKKSAVRLHSLISLSDPYQSVSEYAQWCVTEHSRSVHESCSLAPERKGIPLRVCNNIQPSTELIFAGLRILCYKIGKQENLNRITGAHQENEMYLCVYTRLATRQINCQQDTTQDPALIRSGPRFCFS